ncbi:MAG: DMT family transporter, partial [Rhodospirillaceae bacterium]
MKHEALRFPRSAPKVPLTMHAPVSPPRSDPLKGILMMFGAGIMMSCMHATIRHVSTSGIHPFEIAFFRNVFSLLPLLPWFVHLGLAPLRTNRFGLMFWRALINTACMLGFFTAVSLAPLAEITALGFTAPIYVAILAIFFLDESIGLRRWSAIGVGFIGVFVVLRPGFETISLGHILVLATSFGWGICLVMIKILGRTESIVTITVYMSIMMTPMLLLPAIAVWVWPSWTQLGWLLILGVLGGIGHFMLIKAFEIAEAGVL